MKQFKSFIKRILKEIISTIRLIKNKWIYLVGFLLSILLIGLYFIKPFNSAWCVVSCSTGASLIGAIVLAATIDIKNEKTREEQKKENKRFLSIPIYQAVYRLLNLLSLVFKRVYRIKNQEFKYTNKTATELFVLFSNEIENIKEEIAPFVFANEEISQEQIEKCRLQQKIKEELNSINNVLQEIRDDFHKCREEFKRNKSIFLVNEVMTESEICRIDAFLSILGPQMKQFGVEEPLIEYGKSLKEVEDCQLLDIVENLGFERFVIGNDKGYFDLEEKKK